MSKPTCSACNDTGYQVEGDGPYARDIPCGCRMCQACEGSGVDDVDVEQLPEGGLSVRDIACAACRGSGVTS